MYVRMVKGTVDVMILHAFSCRDVPLRCVLLAFHVSHARQQGGEKIVEKSLQAGPERPLNKPKGSQNRQQIGQGGLWSDL